VREIQMVDIFDIFARENYLNGDNTSNRSWILLFLQ
jgi:hypothetical protein